MPKVSLVVLNWNGVQHLETCFNSIRDQTYKDIETILVDNGSVDGSIGLVQKKFPWVKIVALPENLGFCLGNNAGIKVANGEYVLTLNNDTKFDPNCLKNLMEVAEKNKHVGMFSLKMMFFYEPSLINSTGILVYKDGSAMNRGMKQPDTKQFEEIEYIFGPCAGAALYKKEMLEDIKMGEEEYFDKNFFIYLEDVDLAFRAQLKGWKSMYVPSAIIYHVHSATMQAKSPIKLYLSERNRIWYTIKDYPIGLLLKTPYFTVRRYLYLAKNKKHLGSSSKFKQREFLIAFLKAWIVGIIFIPRAIKKRITIQKNMRITSKEFHEMMEKYNATKEDLINA